MIDGAFTPRISNQSWGYVEPWCPVVPQDLIEWRGDILAESASPALNYGGCREASRCGVRAGAPIHRRPGCCYWGRNAQTNTLQSPLGNALAEEVDLCRALGAK